MYDMLSTRQRLPYVISINNLCNYTPLPVLSLSMDKVAPYKIILSSEFLGH